MTATMVTWPHAAPAWPPPPDRVNTAGTTVTRHRTPTLEVRDALLRAARALLDERGPDALTVRDIATRAGVGVMGVYNRFGSKDGIINALLQQGFDELSTAVAVTPDSDDPRRSIVSGLGRYRAFALANPAMYRLMFDHPLPSIEPSHAARTAARNAFNRLVDTVRLGIATGHLQPGEPDEIAQRLWAACHGAVSLELRHIGFVADHSTHYTALVNTILRGLTTDHPQRNHGT